MECCTIFDHRTLACCRSLMQMTFDICSLCITVLDQIFKKDSTFCLLMHFKKSLIMHLIKICPSSLFYFKLVQISIWYKWVLTHHIQHIHSVAGQVLTEPSIVCLFLGLLYMHTALSLADVRIHVFCTHGILPHWKTLTRHEDSYQSELPAGT